MTRAEKQPVTVTTSSATKEIFYLQKIMNGIITANARTTITSEVPGRITTYQLDEGSYVSKNDLLIQLDTTALLLDMEKARNEMDNALIERNNRIIRDGGIANDLSSVAPDKLNNFNIISGYNKALTTLKELEHQKAKTSIHAPISGWITDISVNHYEYVNVGQDICTIINPASYEVKIFALESDAISMKKGQRITGHPLLNPDLSFSGSIIKKNPIVDENGIVEVYATISGKKTDLFEGMNVRVTMEESVPNQIVVPKTALVKRSGRDVVFTYNAEKGVAEWKYVTIGNENEGFLAITEGISEGDAVIIEGNLNLDHNANVVLQN